MLRIDSMFVNKSAIESKGMIYQSGQLLPVLAASQLLGERQHQFFLEQCHALSRLPDEHFQSFYHKLIFSFADYTQLLPREWNDTLGGLLNLSLERAMRCLFHFDEEYPDTPAVERFAMFSAALLKDISAVITNQKIFITDEEGNAKSEWQPFKGPMNANPENEFYRLISLGNHFQRVARSVTLLLARQIMPEAAFQWIASFPQLFAEWLDALEDDDSGGGRLRKILQLYELPLENSPKTRLPIHDIPDHDSIATKYADLFIAWLKRAIENGEISINGVDSDLFLTEDGVFLDKGLFKKFKDQYNLPVDMSVVQSQLGKVFGLTESTGLDSRVDQLFSQNDANSAVTRQDFLGKTIYQQFRTREGVLISEPALLFAGSIPDLSRYLEHSAHLDVNAYKRLPSLVSFKNRANKSFN